MIITVFFSYSAANMISDIAQEKELRQKELMKMMSVTESDIGWSWYMTFASFHFITALLVTVASDVLYNESEFTLLFIFWLLAFNGIIVFCMTLGATTSKAIRAVIVGVVFFMVGAFLPSVNDFQSGDAGLTQLFSIHPVAAFFYGLLQIGHLEDQGIGLIGSSINISAGNISGYNFGNTIGMLIFDSLFWGFLTWYLNRVIKPDYGQAYPFYFPFLPSFWCPKGAVAETNTKTTEDAGQHYMRGDGTDSIPYEPVGEALRRQATEGKSIELYNLRKEFGEKRAVDGLYLSMYSGQITALLGHNGAGTYFGE
jgi:ATP-binding cassette, subfamily A (ABC1), member 3